MLCLNNPIYGQFNTIRETEKLYRVNRVIGDDSNLTHDSIKGKTDMASMDSAGIGNYFGVSFPLRHLYVTSPFGRRTDPFTRKMKNHNGLDLRASEEEVYAMMAGRVKKIGEDKRSGKYVVLQEGDYQVGYCHLSQVCVNKGIEVVAGEVVGISGNTGQRTTGPHLHITCKRGRKYVDPAVLIQYVKEEKEQALRGLADK